MIEFTLNRNRNGKKSRWAKKYPRKRILKKGSEKAAGWYFHNWYDDGYHYFHGDLHKFLLKNVGRPVDEEALRSIISENGSMICLKKKRT